MKEKIKKIVYSLMVVFILIVIYFVVSPFFDNFSIYRGLFLIVAILGFVFLILGISLIVVGRKEKGKLKFFLLLTGISAIFPLVGSILHNLFYGLAITFENLKFIFVPLEVTFFLISLVIAPILFLVGLIGSIVLLRRVK